MNRLILVGNGFDLAHSLPTAYFNFVDFIWNNFKLCETHDLFKCLFSMNHGHMRNISEVQNFEMFKDTVKYEYRNYMISQSQTNINSLELFYRDNNGGLQSVFKFSNIFFELINVKRVNNWVQIEDLYYEVLLSLVKGDNKFNSIKNIYQLNKEFNEIKLLLNHYISEEIENKYSFTNSEKELFPITQLLEINFKDLKKDSKNKYFLEFPNTMKSDLITYDIIAKDNIHNLEDLPFENLFLDFNYTSTVSNYVSILNNKRFMYGNSLHLQIHGNVKDEDNPINFGFGDEMDDHYKIIENKKDNDYLENIKSFMYLNN